MSKQHQKILRLPPQTFGFLAPAAGLYTWNHISDHWVTVNAGGGGRRLEYFFE